MKQVFFSRANTVTTGTVFSSLFHPPGVPTGWNAAEADRRCVVPTGGIFSNLRVELDGTPGGGGDSHIFTVFKNGVATGLTVTLTGSTTVATDTANSVSVAAGDYVSIKHTTAGSPNTRTPQWQVEFDGSNANESIYCGSSSDAPSTSAAEYNGIHGHQDAWVVAGSRFNVETLVPFACTLSAVYVLLGTAPGLAKSYTVTIYKNGSIEVTTAVVITGAAAVSGNSLGLSISLSPGDRICMECSPSGTPASSTVLYGVLLTATVDGESMVCGTTSDQISTSGSEYQWFKTSADAWTTTEANVKAASGITSWVAKNLYVRLETTTGAAKSYAFTVRQNGADSALTCTITNATTGNDTAHSFTAAVNDDLNMKGVGSSTPAATRVQFGFVQYITSAFVPSLSASRLNQAVKRASAW